MNLIEIEETIKIYRPLLYIDKVVDLQKGKSATCVKLFTYNENFFQGHFVGNPIVPGTILIECMLQSVKLVFYSEYGFYINSALYYDIPVVNFKKKVLPGDELTIEVLLKSGDNNFFIDVVSFVGGTEVCNLKLKITK
jgi:3-hydroxyacyl-[acyl-carrier-protein] dehydratase